MTEEKMKRIITACVSAATVLFVVLLSFLIYQWITIAVQEKRIAEAETEITEINQIIEKGENDLAFYESVIGKDWLALTHGYAPSEK